MGPGKVVLCSLGLLLELVVGVGVVVVERVVATVVDFTGGSVEAVVVFVGILAAGNFSFGLKAGLF